LRHNKSTRKGMLDKTKEKSTRKIRIKIAPPDKIKSKERCKNNRFVVKIEWILFKKQCDNGK